MKIYSIIFLFFIVNLPIYSQLSLKPKQGIFIPGYNTSVNTLSKNDNLRGLSYTLNAVVTPYTNVRIYASSTNQSSVSSTIHQTNPLIIFAGSNTDYGVGYYFTTNGGINWNGGDILPNSISLSSNPICSFDNVGLLYYNYNDLTLIDYKYHPKINYPISI